VFEESACAACTAPHVERREACVPSLSSRQFACEAIERHDALSQLIRVAKTGRELWEQRRRDRFTICRDRPLLVGPHQLLPLRCSRTLMSRLRVLFLCCGGAQIAVGRRVVRRSAPMGGESAAAQIFGKNLPAGTYRSADRSGLAVRCLCVGLVCSLTAASLPATVCRPGAAGRGHGGRDVARHARSHRRHS
jgi:hypothetical protein